MQVRESLMFAFNIAVWDKTRKLEALSLHLLRCILVCSKRQWNKINETYYYVFLTHFRVSHYEYQRKLLVSVVVAMLKWGKKLEVQQKQWKQPIH